MRIIRDYRHCPEEAKGAVIAIGNFDGLHLGHQAVIQTMLEKARTLGAPPAIMSFYPHPRHFFSTYKHPIRLQRLHQKVELLQQWGVELMYLVHFTLGFSKLSAWDFADVILHRHLGAKHVVTGHDFFYGHQRSGSPEILQQDTKKLGIGCTIVDAVEIEGGRCSSTAIRELLHEGKLDETEQLLGRLYSIEGRVQHGDKRGRTIGIPTANINLHRLALPALGAYIAEAWVDGALYPAVANVGLRPTVQGTTPLLEVHLLNQEQNLYGKRMEVSLHQYLRPEIKFDGLEQLKSQIHDDIGAAEAYFLKQGGQQGTYVTHK